MKLLVLSCAETEIAEAVDYYNKQRPGLGYEFAVEMQRSFERIRNHPNAWAPFSTRSRRCLTDRFPYGILSRYAPKVSLSALSCISGKTPDTGKTVNKNPSMAEGHTSQVTRVNIGQYHLVWELSIRRSPFPHCSGPCGALMFIIQLNPR